MSTKIYNGYITKTNISDLIKTKNIVMMRIFNLEFYKKILGDQANSLTKKLQSVIDYSMNVRFFIDGKPNGLYRTMFLPSIVTPRLLYFFLLEYLRESLLLGKPIESFLANHLNTPLTPIRINALLSYLYNSSFSNSEESPIYIKCKGLT